MPTCVHVRPDFAEHALLGFGQWKGQTIVVEGVEVLPNLRESHARQVLCDGLLVLEQGELQKKQLFKPEPLLSLFSLLRTRRLVCPPKRGSAIDELHLLQDAFGQGFSQGWDQFVQHVANQSGQSLAVQPVTAQFFRAGVHWIESISLSRFVLAQQFHLRVGHAPLALEGMRSAINHDLFLHGEVANNPMCTSKPLKLHHVFTVGEGGDQPASLRPPDFLH